ncbi:thiamine-phosphate pyrophosphorylase [Herbaspirillum sp. Sphag1AN]|uniref:thiamine phosphate synthase n=1 Tax=unclassified Herbaspirillum TaxID=2624150 RepID=UPI00161D0F3D|nr:MULTISPECIES: thiamine phosphate synthase [unclassified Herbaspirillum]MBB3213830.1 thiamine-phosphate pyrophosphorylase [Herbaspirillum sp. Sphag1AN]MBB3247027.1 thiamine-phosphate pyrophosphorylase [Herbaspirillum sp. Sphag64]
MTQSAKQWHLKGLYVVTPDWDDTDKLVAATEQAILGGATLVQYRHKTADAAQRQQQASALLAVCRRHSVPFIINDYVELCLSLDADGIHVGGTDASVAEVRAQVGPDKIVGASCYGTLQLARDAWKAGASYVAFGGFYPSRVKKYEFKTAPEIVAESRREIPLPVVVIGGMTQENCQPLIAQGTDMVAAISSVYMTEDVRGAAAAFAALLPAG